jgi:hypothetical protein
VTFTASVSSDGGIPTGAVNFRDGEVELGVGQLTSTGEASFSTSSLSAGDHVITAEYGGDANFEGSLNETALTIRAFTDTTIQLTTNPNPSVFGEAVSLSAVISSSEPPGGDMPTGVVEFHDGSILLTSSPVVNGASTASTSVLAVGSHQVTATYSGDEQFLGSSTVSQHAVQQAATDTALQASTSTAVFGEAVTFTATITVVSPGLGEPAGTVSFADHGLAIGSASIEGGTASLVISDFPVGTREITATYEGDESFGGSPSSAFTVTVNQAATTTALNSSANPSGDGQQVTFTATVALSPPGAGLPAGNVTFYDMGAPLGTQPLAADGTASFATSALATGQHEITAAYAGSESFAASTSNAIQQSVGTRQTTTMVAALPNPSLPGESVRLEAVVSPVSGPGTPAGNVTFSVGAANLGERTLSAGVAVLDVASLAIGAHSIQASYGGAPIWAPSASSVVVSVDPRLGGEFRVNTRTQSSQQHPAIAQLNNGSFVVAWDSNAQDGSGTGVYAQRYSSAGLPANGEFRVNTTTANSQAQPAITGLQGGGFAVVWESAGQDGSGSGIYGQRYDSSGVKAGGQVRINATTAGDQTDPAITALASGGYVVAWVSAGQDGSGLGVYAQRYSAAGTKVGGQIRVNNTTAGDQSSPSIATVEGDGFVVAWQSAGQDGSGLGIFAQRFTSAGTKIGPQLRANTVITGDQRTPSVAALDDGGFVVGWVSAGDGDGFGIFGQRYATDGTKVGVQFRVNTTSAGDQDQPTLSGFQDGGYMVAWASRNQDAPGWEVYGQAFDAVGQRANVEFGLNTTAANDQSQPAIAPFLSGEFAAAWASRDQDGSLEGVYAQRFDLNW